ncbi:DUF6542 domain-containing protein [Nocardia farcinica]|uniref:DUF6542 domain-containing protein n=1 Tax=Nocardia farcinica TaxID=37329 RepID=UPI0018944FEE|nr:DUF6542 domain-containing protein [Nocardia farcinica]MBF6252617.1 hypothetical protein [Nocardia farcinica]
MAASQRVRSRVPALQRSILPTVPGVPAWSAVLIAIGCTLLGFLLDARGDAVDLTSTFAVLYVVGCVAAVLAVRMRGLFTTLVLPPLLLFVAVPLAYQQLSGGGSTGLKDILLNLAIPLVNRFPTMMLATVLVLLIGGYRIVSYRRETGTGHRDEVKRATSWGRTPAPKKKPARKAPEPVSARKKVRRPRPEVDEPETDKYEAPLLGRRPPRDVADVPPRVNGRPPREGRPPVRGAARPAAAMSRAEAEAAPRARARGSVPPHPQPNVRYRDREPGRPQRRKPESL